MPYISSPQDLREQFVELPDNVRKWLASEKVLAVVTDMNERLEYFGDKVSVIPWLITRLAVKDLAPKYFMSELRDYLVVDENEARAITEEIDKRILRPIEPALTRLDIDLNSLYLGQAAPVAPQAVTPTIGAREHFGIVDESEVVALRQAQGVIKKDAQDVNKQIATPVPPSFAKAPAGEEGPVILHTEKEEISQVAHEKPGEATSAPRQSFSINIPQSKYKKPAAPPPVTVRVEVPGAQMPNIKYQISKGEGGETMGGSPSTGSAGSPQANSGNNTPPKIMKVVHYSPFYTKLIDGKD